MRVLIIVLTLLSCKPSDDELRAATIWLRALGPVACATNDDKPAGIIGELAPDATQCLARPSLIPPAIRALGANYVFVERGEHGERVVDVDFGGGFIEANGYRISGSAVAHYDARD